MTTIFVCVVYSVFWGALTIDPTYSLRWFYDHEMWTIPVEECVETTTSEYIGAQLWPIWEQIDEELIKHGTDPDSITLD